MGMQNLGYKALGIVALSALCVVLLSGASISSDDTPHLTQRLQPPTHQHWLGTDELGRDVLNRSIRGAALSLRFALLAWASSVAIAVALCGFLWTRPHSIWSIGVLGLISLVYSMPGLILFIGILFMLGPSIAAIYFAISSVCWVIPARQLLLYMERLKYATFMNAAEAIGYSPSKMFTFVVLPEAIKPVLIASLALVPEFIAIDAGLAVFGLGIQPPTPSLGNLLVDSLLFTPRMTSASLAPVGCIILISLMIRLLARPISSVSEN
jgi:peptide/nickel transport system permease protein